MLEFCQPMRKTGSWLLPKSSPYREALNHWILRFSSSGILEQIRRRWWRPGKGQNIPFERLSNKTIFFAEPDVSTGASNAVISIQQVYLAFLAGGAVVVATLLILLAEIAMKRTTTYGTK